MGERTELFQTIQKANPHLPLYRVSDAQFNQFGRVLSGFDAEEMIAATSLLEVPDNGVSYDASVPELEACERSVSQLANECFGEMDIQIGYCRGYSTQLNAFEWHKSSEINIAITPLVLLLGRMQDIQDGRYDSSHVKAFFLEKGDVVEIYATTLHFCPCNLEKGGFGCIVVLPDGTNLLLEHPTKESLLFRKNKWLLAHEKNKSLIERGAKPAIFGENLTINR